MVQWVWKMIWKRTRLKRMDLLVEEDIMERDDGMMLFMFEKCYEVGMEGGGE